ncbi:MAG: hypothetical protein KDD33_09705 [Bdellovibrionales bacterium]|nr:hypothetical protein [Bdellovibrionales bacterium]
MPSFRSLKKIPKKQLQLYADKLLYTCDILVAVKETEEEIQFLGKGRLRMGPLKSDVHLQSDFVKEGDDLLFKSYRLQVDRMGFFENYEMRGNEIRYSNSKGMDLNIQINNQAFQDPLSFLMETASEGFSNLKDRDVRLLIGSKIETFTWKRAEGILNFLKRNRLMARFIEEAGKLFVEIPKLKAKLELRFK